MNIHCNESAAWVLIIMAIAGASAIGTVYTATAKSKASVECYKTQQAAIAASAPKMPTCP